MLIRDIGFRIEDLLHSKTTTGWTRIAGEARVTLGWNGHRSVGNSGKGPGAARGIAGGIWGGSEVLGPRECVLDPAQQGKPQGFPGESAT